MGRGAQAQTRQLTDQQLASANAMNQQLSGQHTIGKTLLPAVSEYFEQPGLDLRISGGDRTVAGALASLFDSLQQAAQLPGAHATPRASGN